MVKVYWWDELQGTEQREARGAVEFFVPQLATHLGENGR